MARHSVLFDIINVFSKAKAIKQDEEVRQKSVRFGITSIIFSVISVAFAFGASLLLSLILDGNDPAVLLFIFIVAGFIACLGATLITLVSALVRVIAQLSINRKALSWIALIIFILCIAAAAVIFIVL